MMVEGGSKECQEEDLITAIEIAHKAIQVQVKAQEELREKVGVKSKREYAKPYRNEELHGKIREFSENKIKEIAASASAKQDRSDAFNKLKDELVVHLGVLPEEDEPLVYYYFGELQYHYIRDMILNKKVRLDGRGLEDDP